MTFAEFKLYPSSFLLFGHSCKYIYLIGALSGLSLAEYFVSLFCASGISSDVVSFSNSYFLVSDLGCITY